MTLVPIQEGGGAEEFVESSPTPKPNSIRKYAIDRQTKMLAVVLKLAQMKSYDIDSKITGDNGQRYDVIPLLIHCFSPGKTIRGLESFIDILHQANVKPSDIINESVRDQLAKKRGFRPRLEPVQEIPEIEDVEPQRDEEEEEEEEVFVDSPPDPPREQPKKRKLDPVREPRMTRARKRKSKETIEEGPSKVAKTMTWDKNDSDNE